MTTPADILRATLRACEYQGAGMEAQRRAMTLRLKREINEAIDRKRGVAWHEVPACAMRVGPGTDAVVWNICDTSHVECEL